ncbi:hypothetical protein K1719_040295 [Acacia pycnantha]|nr:hypothetical protein K1719_040295 [Acacia pycnantha]
MNCLFWNVRGAGARSFPSLIRGLVRSFDINFVALFETRCGGDKAQRIAGMMGFSNIKIIDADGFKGGIWCLWSDKFRQVDVLCSTNQFVHVRITSHLLQTWELTLVYGSPNIVQRRILWRDLMQLSLSVHMPWCLGGDFNATLVTDERSSGGAQRGPDREFCKFVEDVALNDLGFIGPPFTWGRTGVASRLDRVLGSNSWQELFPNAIVKHLNWYKSDHRPLLLQLDGCRRQPHGDRPFVFLAAWVLDERFSPFVSGTGNVSCPGRKMLISLLQLVEIGMARRKRNFIGALKGPDDAWVYDGAIIKEMVVSHLSTVFQEEQSRRPPLVCSVSFPEIDSAESL